MQINKNRIIKKVFSIVLGIVMIFVTIPILPVYAEETDTQPRIYLKETTSYQGSSGYIYVYASNFENIGAIKYMIKYDSSVITITGAYADNLASGNVSDINHLEAGFVKQSIASVDGINGNGRLMYINYTVKKDAPVGKYPLEIIVEEAVDTSTKNVTIVKQKGILIVKEKSSSAKVASFTTQLTKSSLTEGETFDYSLCSYGIGNLAGGNFEFIYDRDVLELIDVQLENPLKNGSGTAAINQSTAGYVKVSYAGTDAISAGYNTSLVTLSFLVKKDETLTSDIKFSPRSLQDKDLNSMDGNEKTTSVRIIKKNVISQNPQFRLEYEELSHGETYQVTAIVDGNSGLAAGDFVINYDKQLSVCTAVDVDPDVAEKNGIVITKEKIDNGQIGFSFVSSTGISEDQRMIVMTFQRLKPGTNMKMTSVGKKVVNKDSNAIILDYPELNVDMSHFLREWEVITEPSCEIIGVEKRFCDGCDYEVSRNIEKLGHEFEIEWAVDREPSCSETGLKSRHCKRCDATCDEQVIPLREHTEVIDAAKEPSCVETGLTEGKHCSVCKTVLIKQEIVPAKGHELVQIEAKEATCTESGNNEYWTCSVCKKVFKADKKTETTVEGEILSAKGHIEVIDAAKEPSCVETGLTEGKHCLVCKTVLIKQEIVPAKGHAFSSEWTIDKPATTNGTGLKSKHCKRCDAKTDITVIPMLTYENLYATLLLEGATETTIAAIYPDGTDIDVIQQEMQEERYITEMLAWIKCSGANGVNGHFLAALPTETYLVAAYNSGKKTFYYQKLKVGDTGLSRGVVVDFSNHDVNEESRVHTFLYGDVDQNGKIDFADVLYAKRYLASWNNYRAIDDFATDVNLNGKVEIDDISIISRYVAGWEGYEKLPVIADPLPMA